MLSPAPLTTLPVSWSPFEKTTTSGVGFAAGAGADWPKITSLPEIPRRNKAIRAISLGLRISMIGEVVMPLTYRRRRRKRAPRKIEEKKSCAFRGLNPRKAASAGRTIAFRGHPAEVRKRRRSAFMALAARVCGDDGP
jgi:hypothetical protein